MNCVDVDENMITERLKEVLLAQPLNPLKTMKLAEPKKVQTRDSAHSTATTQIGTQSVLP